MRHKLAIFKPTEQDDGMGGIIKVAATNVAEFYAEELSSSVDSQRQMDRSNQYSTVTFITRFNNEKLNLLRYYENITLHELNYERRTFKINYISFMKKSYKYIKIECIAEQNTQTFGEDV